MSEVTTSSSKEPVVSGTRTIIVAQTKSVGASLLLTFFLGPLGVLYSSILAGILLIVLAVILAPLTFGIGTLLMWPVSIICGYLTVKRYNKNLIKAVGQSGAVM